MDGSLLSIVLIVIVTTISLAVWLILVYRADSHPQWGGGSQARGHSSSRAAGTGHLHGLRVWNAWPGAEFEAKPGETIQEEQIMSQMASLYDRLGGFNPIRAVVDSAVARVAADDRVNQKFARSDLSRLEKEFTDQLCQATGGPCTYTGRSMRDTHAGMKVTGGEWNAVIEDIEATLEEFKVPETEQKELLDLLLPLRSEIVEVESPDTGTPLPDSYQTAPPLS